MLKKNFLDFLVKLEAVRQAKIDLNIAQAEICRMVEPGQYIVGDTVFEVFAEKKTGHKGISVTAAKNLQ